MKRILNKLFYVKPSIQDGLTVISRREPMVVTPEFEQWCAQLNVSVLADKRSINIQIVMGDKVKFVNLQSF